MISLKRTWLAGELPGCQCEIARLLDAVAPGKNRGKRSHNNLHTQTERQLQITRQMIAEPATKPARSMAARNISQSRATAAMAIASNAS
jgi:hypothetical protein